tara:strand:+ start:898 stop:1314 length:417 start_codon:yes stop_codon:yes gene_type:complete
MSEIMRKEEREEVTINYTVPITDEMIEHILSSAFEGGSTYWADNVSCEDREDMLKVGGWKHEYLTKTKKKDAVMYIHDGETEEKHAITKKSIVEALQKMDNPKYKCTKALKRILDEKDDSGDADLVLQMACFNEVVYG